jgi:hypothetical protein
MTPVAVKRVSELIKEVEEKSLVLRPFFQRRLVWTNVVKDYFLETVHLGLPFPEIFMATGQLDTQTMQRVNWLVDGQQRVSTLREYVLNSDDLVRGLKRVRPYAELSEDEKRKFLDYQVIVRDLGTVTEEQIREIFSQINSTDYSLRTMERLNALFSGAYKQFCENLSLDSFFERHNVFTSSDQRRMRDLDFCVILITTLLSTYYHRDELNREYLKRYNDEFPEGDRLRGQISSVFEFVERCGFGERSRPWKKTDLLTLLVELHSALAVRGLPLDPALVGASLKTFYSRVDDLYAKGGAKEDEPPKVDAEVFRYLKAATKATNDKYARVDRGEIIGKILTSTLPKSDPADAKLPRKRRKNS